MLSRFLALVAVLMLAYASTDAHAYASSLQPENAHRGFSAVEHDRIKEIDALSAERTKENPASAYDCTSRQTLGEQFDANLGFQYLRARYLDPRSGRFLTQDSFGGAQQDAKSLHKYLYADANPVMYADPTGHYTQSFGNKVHKYACDDYIGFSQHRDTKCDVKVEYDVDGSYAKPDILDVQDSLYAEVKPVSLPGIISGKARIEAYDRMYGQWGYARLLDYRPRPTVIDSRRVFFMNIEGIIFYTDKAEEIGAFAGATIATLASRYKSFWKNRRMDSDDSDTPMGGEVVAARAVYSGSGSVAAAGQMLAAAIIFEAMSSIRTPAMVIP